VLVAVALLCPGTSAGATPLSAGGGPGEVEPHLSEAERIERAAGIRDAAAEVGMTNAALLAGIAQAETGLAHCWSEATWACQGPASSSCDGGPVIAGSADGPCELQQGGLGMFQFDAGTYQDTMNAYGADVVTVAGNTQQVIPFLITRAIQSVPGVTTEAEALEWFNSIPIADDDPDFEEWIYFVAWRYNGCQGCASVQKKYRDATHTMVSEFGSEFWVPIDVKEAGCDPVPTMGRVVEEDEQCFHREGPREYWGQEESGHGGTLAWTTTTDAEVVDNSGSWQLRFRRAGDYHLSVFTDGGTFGQSTMAAYEIAHGGETDVVVIDQSAAKGFQSLGVFHFAEGTDQQLTLADNTGEPWAANGTRLMFDALRVRPAVPGEGGGEDGSDSETSGQPGSGDLGGGCSAPGGSGTSTLFAMLFFGTVCRRFSVRCARDARRKRI